jgi:hypothetical protein
MLNDGSLIHPEQQKMLPRAEDPSYPEPKVELKQVGPSRPSGSLEKFDEVIFICLDGSEAMASEQAAVQNIVQTLVEKLIQTRHGSSVAVHLCAHNDTTAKKYISMRIRLGSCGKPADILSKLSALESDIGGRLFSGKSAFCVGLEYAMMTIASVRAAMPEAKASIIAICNEFESARTLCWDTRLLLNLAEIDIRGIPIHAILVPASSSPGHAVFPWFQVCKGTGGLVLDGVTCDDQVDKLISTSVVDP